MQRREQQPKGFSLLEILIALFIFTLISLILAKSLRTVITAQEATQTSAEQLRELQMALLLFSRDLEQALAPPSSSAQGGEKDAFVGTPTSLSFVHLGFISDLEYSRYHVQNGQLRRDSQSVLAPSRKQSQGKVLIAHLNQLEFRYLDNKNRFHAFWPDSAKNDKLPTAVAVRLQLTPEPGDVLEQIYLLPQQVSHVPS